MLRLRGLWMAIALLGIGVSTAAGEEVPPETLDALGLSGMTVIEFDPAINWSSLPRYPESYYDTVAFYPEPGVRYYTLPTLQYLRRRLTNVP